MPTEGGKEKKTRRRLRVSCVECTKRRQRCDRQTPCGLCISRGVSHLCRWESVPVARPTPARPPISAAQAAADASMIQQLSERIAALEKSLALQATQKSPDSVPRTTSEQSPSKPSNPKDTSLPSLGSIPEGRAYQFDTESTDLYGGTDFFQPQAESDTNGPDGPLQKDVHEAALALAQLSLAHHGEYLGRGTVVCTLHKLGDYECAEFPFAGSTDPTCKDQSSSLSSPTSPVRILVQALPPKSQTQILLRSFFTEVNWRFGVPEKWFYSACDQMWRVLEGEGNGIEINANWLSLLFAVLAHAPQDPSIPLNTQSMSRDFYFSRSLTSRRLAEDAYLSAPSFSPLASAAEGAVLSCFAATFLCMYLAERGRVSEAWKLLGSAIRVAQSVGMHRDTGWDKWHRMSEDERVLRVRSWWGLTVMDRMFSCVLGRPFMIQSTLADIPEPEPPSDPRNTYDTFQAAIVKLSDIIGEVGETCLGMGYTPYDAVFNMDRKFEEWEAGLPSSLHWHRRTTAHAQAQASSVVDLDPVSIAAAARHCYTITTWYLACRMTLHRSYITQITPPGFQHPLSPVPHKLVMKQSREECIRLAMDLVRLQCAPEDGYGHGLQRGNTNADPDTSWAFERMFFLFDGALTLVSALTKTPVQERTREAEDLVESAMQVLQKAAQAGERTGKSEIARRALGVLTVLARETAWRRGGVRRETGTLSQAQAVQPRTTIDPNSNSGKSQPWSMPSPSQQQEQQQQQQQQQQTQRQQTQPAQSMNVFGFGSTPVGGPNSTMMDGTSPLALFLSTRYVNPSIPSPVGVFPSQTQPVYGSFRSSVAGQSAFGMNGMAPGNLLNGGGSNGWNSGNSIAQRADLGAGIPMMMPFDILQETEGRWMD